MSGGEAELVAEQLRHALDLHHADLNEVKLAQQHDRVLANHRLEALEAQVRDHEQRLRLATDGVTQFKVWSGLATGGSWLISAAALLKAWLGG